MYRVYADGVLIHDDYLQNDKNHRLISPSLSLKDNAAGAFTATIPVDNVCYNTIQCFDTTIDIYRINQNGSQKWIWSGRPLKISKDFYNYKKLTTEGVLAFLNDIVVPIGAYKRVDLVQVARFLIGMYNSHASQKRRIDLGGVSTVSSTGAAIGFHDYEFDGDNVFSYLSQLMEDWGLHARIRRTGDSYLNPGYVLDLVTDTQLPMSSQSVNFGRNLLDYTSDDDWSELVTAILPYGAVIKEEEEETPEGGEEGGDDSGSSEPEPEPEEEEEDLPEPHYTIAGLSPSNQNFYIQDVYLVNRTMEAMHGRIEQTVEWSDIEDPVELLGLAEAYLNDYTYMTQTLTVKVLDLHYLIGSNEVAFDFLSQINCYSNFHGLHDTFIVTEMSIPFDNPENTSFTMKRETRGLYGSDRKAGGGYSSKISATSWHIPAREGILRVARENAAAIINMMTSGYVTLVPTEDGDHIWALTVTNGIDEASSTQMWKWTLGGLMFQDRSSISDEWNPPQVALTMDGQIVATRITTGIFAVDDGHGGYLILADMDSGTLQIGSFDVTNTSIFNGKPALHADNVNGVYLGYDGIAIGTTSSGLFKVDVLNSFATIAGFEFNGTSIFKDKNSVGDDSTTGVYIGTDGIAVGDDSNGLFKVDISNGIAMIAGFTFNESSIFKDKNSVDSDSTTGVYIGTDGIAVGDDSSGLFKVNTQSNTAFIAGFTFDDGSFHSNNRSSLISNESGVYLGTDGISTGSGSLYTAIYNGYLSGGSGSESGYISFNVTNTANNQNGIRVAGKGCVAILTGGAFGVGEYKDESTAATFYEGATTSITVPAISGGYKYYTYTIAVTWKDYTISGTSFKVPTEIKLNPTEATGTFDGITNNVYEFKYGILNTKTGGSGSGSGSGEGGSGSGSGSGEGGSGSGEGGSGSSSGTHTDIVNNTEYVFFDTIDPPSEWTQRNRTYAGIGVPKTWVTAAQNFVAEHSEYKLWIAVSETGSPNGGTNPYFTICLTTTEPTFGTDYGANPSFTWTGTRNGFWQGVSETTISNSKSYLIKNITFNNNSTNPAGVVDAARPVYSYYWGDLTGSSSGSGESGQGGQDESKVSVQPGIDFDNLLIIIPWSKVNPKINDKNYVVGKLTQASADRLADEIESGKGVLVWTTQNSSNELTEIDFFFTNYNVGDMNYVKEGDKYRHTYKNTGRVPISGERYTNQKEALVIHTDCDSDNIATETIDIVNTSNYTSIVWYLNVGDSDENGFPSYLYPLSDNVQWGNSEYNPTSYEDIEIPARLLSGGGSGSGSSDLTNTITLEHASTPSTSYYHMYGTDGKLKDSDAPSTATIILSDALLNAVKNTLSHGYDVVIKVDPTNNTGSTGVDYYSIWSIENGKYEKRNNALYNNSGSSLQLNAISNGNQNISRSNVTYSNGSLSFDISSEPLRISSMSIASGSEIVTVGSNGGYFKIIEADSSGS